MWLVYSISHRVPPPSDLMRFRLRPPGQSYLIHLDGGRRFIVRQVRGLTDRQGGWRTRQVRGLSAGGIVCSAKAPTHHTCTHVHMHACTHAHTPQARMHTCTHTHTHTTGPCVDTHVRKHRHTWTHAHAPQVHHAPTPVLLQQGVELLRPHWCGGGHSRDGLPCVGRGCNSQAQAKQAQRKGLHCHNHRVGCLALTITSEASEETQKQPADLSDSRIQGSVVARVGRV